MNASPPASNSIAPIGTVVAGARPVMLPVKAGTFGIVPAWMADEIEAAIDVMSVGSVSPAALSSFNRW
ncbi:MAG TPA: hypothetical protein VNO25_07010 [Streptosporangiaceae bacterium]|nr:hypothetical protein [Streptosporangiaceae bacterium]